MQTGIFKKYHISGGYYKGAEARLVHSGNDYFETLETLICSATRSLHLQTYIFNEDDTGKRVAKALQEAAARGVEVSVMLDGFGSKALSHKFLNELRSSAIHFRFFSPLFSTQNIYVGRRLHHKVLVADKSTALIGGINIADKYHGSATMEPWLDYAILLKGSICEDIDAICWKMYNIRDLRRKWKGFRLRKKKQEVQQNTNLVFVSIKRNDRLLKRNQISRSYLHAIQNAKNSIYITGSYFLPGTKLRNALINASKRGVEVHLIMAGISDTPLFHNATKWLYDLLFRNGIKIYEWKKSVLHGKVAVIDNNWSTVGSFNLNHLSAYGSVEMNVDVLDEKFARELKLDLKSKIQTGCDEILPTHQNNHLMAKFKRWFAYQITRMSVNFVVIFPYINPFKKFE